MRYWILLGFSFVLLSVSIGCVIQPRGEFKFYEGDERPKEELALIDWCHRWFKYTPRKGREIRIDGEDLLQAASASDVWIPCGAWIVGGEHEVYYWAAGRPSTGGTRILSDYFEGVVNFEAGRTYYFFFDNTFGWFGYDASVWIEDDKGNVVAGEKL